MAQVILQTPRSQWCSTSSWLKANHLPFKTSSDEKQKKPAICCLSAAAELLGHQQGVVAIDLQQVEQEEPVSVGVQTHGSHALLC